MNRRRTLCTAAGAALLAGAVPLFGQRTAFRIGWIATGSAAHGAPFLDALRQGLRGVGYAEGTDFVIDARWGDYSAQRAQTVAAELAAWHPHVVVTLGPVVSAVRRASPTTPIVFGFSGDPVAAGLAKSLPRPGGNLTGMTFMALELAAKRIELMKTVMPELRRIAVLANSQHPGDDAERRTSSAAAAAAGLEVELFEAPNGPALDETLAAIRKSRCEAAVMFPVTSIVSNGTRIASWSMKHRIPAISGWAQFADDGNLMSYGANLSESFRRLATHVDRILKGAPAGDLPVELPLHVELVVNRTAARELGVTIPGSVLARADRLIG